MKKGLALTFLIAILVFGTFLRMTHLNEESLWLDEGITYYNSTADSYVGVWDKTAELDQSPPGYYFVMHTYLNIFGENEFGFRLIPVVFGVLSILFLYLLMEAMFGLEVGLTSAFLLAVNPFHIGFSTESRMYVLLGLLCLMAFYFMYKALKSESVGWGWWLGFVLCSVAGIYTHNFFVFVLLALALVFLFLIWGCENKRLAKFFTGIFSAGAVVLCYLPWLPNFLRQMDVERYWMAENSFSNLKEYFLDFSNGNAWILYGFLLLGLIGVIYMMYKKGILVSLSLVLFLIIGIGAPLAYSLIFEPILKIRYVVFLVPIWLGLVSLGLEAMRRISLVLQTAIVVLIIYTWVPWQASAFPIEYGEDFRGLTEIVLENPAPVVVHSPSIAHVINFYNQGRVDILPFPFSDDLNEFNIEEEDKSKFRDLIRGIDSFYLVVTHSHENPHGLLYIWSDEYCDSSLGIDVEGMNVYLFEGCN